MNSSTETSANFRMERKVPVANSECTGMTQPVMRATRPLQYNVTSFLPDLNEAYLRSRARIARTPETRGSLGKACLENSYKGATVVFRRKLF